MLLLDNLVINNTDANGIRRYDVNEMNLLFLISFKINHEKTNNIVFAFSELEQHTNFKNLKLNNEDYFKKIRQITWDEHIQGTHKYHLLLNSYEVNNQKETVTFFINPIILDSIAKISAGLEQTDLNFFLDIASSYAKSAYLLTNLMVDSKKYIINFEDFRTLLNIPKKYKMSDIDKKVFFHIEKNLALHFSSFDIEKINAKKKNKVEYLKFNFDKKAA